MTSTEDRVRAAMDAITSQVDAALPAPLPLPPSAARHRWRGGPQRGWGRWLAPAAAAVAVIAVAVSLAAVRNTPAGRSAAPVSAAPVRGVPEYYVALPDKSMLSFSYPGPPMSGAADAVVGDTFSGRRLATVPAPAGWLFVSVTGASNDRTFVVRAGSRNGYQGFPTRWYMIQLTPGAAHLATLRELTVPQADSGTVVLSPDGAELALSDGQSVRVYSTATGALLHTWSGEADLLSWTSDGRQLALETRATEKRGMRVGIRLLPAGGPGHDLIADSRLVWSANLTNAPVPGSPQGPPQTGLVGPSTSISFVFPTGKSPFGCGQPDANIGEGLPPLSVLVSGDGTTLACGASGVFRDPGNLAGNACPAIPAWNEEGFLEYSTATGKLAGTLYRTKANCVPYVSPSQLLWISDSGDAVLGFIAFEGTATRHQGPVGPVYRFGLFTPGRFTPLPMPPTLEVGGIGW